MEEQKAAFSEGEASATKQKRSIVGNIIFGCVIAAAAAAAIGYTAHWQKGINSFSPWLIVMAVAIVALAVIPFRMNQVVGAITFVLTPIITFGAMECLTHDVWMMAISPIILNMIVFYAFFFLFWGLTGSARWGSIISVIVALVVGMVNYFALLCRNSPVLPWDIKSAATALSVSDNYSLSTTWRVCLILLIFLALIALAWHNTLSMKKWSLRGIAAGASVGVVLLMNALTHNDRFEANFMTFSNLFTQTYTYRDNGFVISFMLNLQYMEISKPVEYYTSNVGDVFHQACIDYEEQYGGADSVPGESPNIIIIMDEAFTDLAYLNEFDTVDEEGNAVDYMPFIHSLMEDEEIVSGNLYVSVCGGNTANSEFEVLTGNTMAFLPTGSVAYQQYIDGDMPSLATVLKEQGYETTGIHPYYASGWDRDEVYPWLGLDTSYFKDSFKYAKFLRKYISDESAFDKIIDVYEDGGDEPQFIFTVTMQNHGGYSEIFENAPIEVYLEDIENRPATENYLSLVKRTDASFHQLVDYFEQQDEPTIILFFGDHQPSDYVANCIMNLDGKTTETRTLEEQQKRYIVPFVMWSNYDTGNEAEKYDAVSANYLSSILLEYAGLEMNSYQKFLLELMEEYPVITANIYMDAEGNMTSIQDLNDADLLEYQWLQYNYMFDGQKDNEFNYMILN